MHSNLRSHRIINGNFQHPPLAKWLYGIAQLTVGHASVPADRVVAAMATLLTGVVLVIWIARLAGRWTGLLAGALAVLLPEAVQGTTLRFGRYAFLDPVAELFVAVYLLLLWEWFASERRRAWLFAAASGVAIGCAVASKENGFLAAVVPVLLCVLASWREPRLLVQRLGQMGLAVVASLGTFALTYAPFSSPFQRIRYLIQFQAHNSRHGHVIGFAGRVSGHPPWWANLWFAGHGMGAAVTVFLLASAALAGVLRRDRLGPFWSRPAPARPGAAFLPRRPHRAPPHPGRRAQLPARQAGDQGRGRVPAGPGRSVRRGDGSGGDRRLRIFPGAGGSEKGCHAAGKHGR